MSYNFLYPLKTSEKFSEVFWSFQEVLKETSGAKWANVYFCKTEANQCEKNHNKWSSKIKNIRLQDVTLHKN